MTAFLYSESAKWYCSTACKRKPKKRKKAPKKSLDHVHEYTTDMLWQGLTILARNDAVSENDGPHMNAFWRIDMLNFAERNHYKYLKIGHRLLAGTITNFVYTMSCKMYIYKCLPKLNYSTNASK